MLASSLSFRRKKKGQRGTGNLIQRTTSNSSGSKSAPTIVRQICWRLSRARVFVILSVLFALSFGMAYLTSQFDSSTSSNNSTAVATVPREAAGDVARRKLPSLDRIQALAQRALAAAAASPKQQPQLPVPRTLFPKARAPKQQKPNRGGRLRGARLNKKVIKNDDGTISSKSKQSRSKTKPSQDEAASKQQSAVVREEQRPGTPAFRGEGGAAASDNGITTTTHDGDTSVVEDYHFQRYSETAPSCRSLTEDEIDFTLVTQLSLNRLWMLEHHCSRWGAQHAISMAVFVGEEIISVDEISDQLQALGCSPEHVTVQTVSGYSEEEYPVNVLRNRALSVVQTTHIVYVDVDFWESIDLYDTLQLHKAVLAADPRQALVMPAFQLARQCKEWRDCRENNIPLMPLVKDELLDLMVQHVADWFDPTNPGGHGSTRYADWLHQSETELLPITCVNSNRYEPYLVFRHCRDLPPFQEAFTGYGKNKMTWVMQLRRAGYRLRQLGGSFLVHYPHLDSPARMHWNGGKHGAPVRKPHDESALANFKRGQIDHAFVEFRAWLDRTVPDDTAVPKCEDALDDDQRLWIEHDKLRH